MTADGDVLYKGRNKDIVIRGGENIFPKEIEYISKYTGVTGKYMYDSTLRCCWVNAKRKFFDLEDSNVSTGSIPMFPLVLYSSAPQLSKRIAFNFIRGNICLRC